ncbi:MAG: potassium transporter Kup [bacterium]|nr:potassium transporter Kup [bacterium]
MSESITPKIPADATSPSPKTSSRQLEGTVSPRAEARVPNGGGKRLAILAFTTLGVVYGDIGTSPLYAIRECFHGRYGINPSASNVLGVLSLVAWALILIVSLKYLTFVLRADNRGEGGVIALTAQLIFGQDRYRGAGALIMMGLFAAALLYGDGMITPAISVLSAVEGISIAAPSLESWVVPVTVGILVCLFSIQRKGTYRVGVLFGPVTTLWLLVIAALGIRSILAHPDVLAAFLPKYGLSFLSRNGSHGFMVLGAVFLVVTGTEALFADMGHFGRRPIRLAWYVLVLPALLCNYFGQGALLLGHPELASRPFYSLVPSWGMFPVIALATAATIIASQAVISGAFSLTRQAVQLGYLPRVQIIHTSPTEIGQIYIPQVNWIIMAATIGLVLGFRSSSGLAAAYGVAVTATMIITTVLFATVARRRWQWSGWWFFPLIAVFFAVDLSFLAANFSKISHGAWIPLAVAAVVFIAMTTWKKGRDLLAEKLYSCQPTLEDLIKQIQATLPHRVRGKAIFLAGNAKAAPPALTQNLRHNRVLHESVAVLTIRTEDFPEVGREDKVQVEEIGSGFWRIKARFGYMEEPNVPYILALAREKGLSFPLDECVFFLGRERIMADRKPAMSLWREAVFSFLSKNALGATRFFHIPPEQVVELGTQVEL